jgi:hypothetical protein
VLDGWADLDQREAAVCIGARQPILVGPEFLVDPVLAGFSVAPWKVGVLWPVVLRWVRTVWPVCR